MHVVEQNTIERSLLLAECERRATVEVPTRALRAMLESYPLVDELRDEVDGLKSEAEDLEGEIDDLKSQKSEPDDSADDLRETIKDLLQNIPDKLVGAKKLRKAEIVVLLDDVADIVREAVEA